MKVKLTTVEINIITEEIKKLINQIPLSRNQRESAIYNDYLKICQLICDVFKHDWNIPQAYLADPVTKELVVTISATDAACSQYLQDKELKEIRYVMLKACFEAIYATNRLTGQELTAAFHSLNNAFHQLPTHFGPQFFSILLGNLVWGGPMITCSLAPLLLLRPRDIEIKALDLLLAQVPQEDSSTLAQLNNKKTQLSDQLATDQMYVAFFTLLSLFLLLACTKLELNFRTRQRLASPPTLAHPEPNQPAFTSIEEYIKYRLQKQADAAKEQKKAAKEKALRLQQQKPDETPPVIVKLAPESRPSALVAAPTLYQKKREAQAIADRQNFKDQSRRARRSGIFDDKAIDHEAAPSITTFRFYDSNENIELFEIDLCSGGIRNPGADHYEIARYSFILANINNPLLPAGLSENMQNLLHASQLRGFIGENAEGTGLKKYTKKQNKPFVAIKTKAEERVLCAIINLNSVGLNHLIEMIVPVESFANHKAYEDAVNDPTRGEMLIKQVLKRLTITEDPTALQDALPPVVATP